MAFRRNFFVGLAIAGFLAVSILGGIPARGATEMTAVRVERAPKLDGVLSEAEWLLAEPATDFLQREPQDNAPATERTEVRLIYDHRALYIGAWCHDREPDKIAAYSLARDFDPSCEDVFLVCLDTYRDRRSSYYIATNANGARYDALGFNDGASFDINWNGVWDVRTSRDDKGFYVEMAIPFSTLRFSDDSVQVWGVNFERDVQRRREFDFWQPLPRGVEALAVSRAGTLLGLANIRRGNDIEVKPYAVAGWQGDQMAGRRKLDNTSVTRIGGDLKMPITSTLTLDVTANPDFAQIEDDRAVINLTRYPFFFSERREFFLENSGTFNFNFAPSSAALFYSRRIGLNDLGQRVPIWGGARVVGKLDAYDVGALVMQTGETETETSDNFAVARVKRNVLGTSYVGILATNKEQSSRYNRTVGTDALFRFPNFYKRDLFGFGWAAAKTFTPELENRQNGAYRAYLEYPNDWLYSTASVRRVERNFNPEVGYVARYGTAAAVNGAFRYRKIGLGLDNITVKPLDVYYHYDLDGRIETIRYGFTPLSFMTRKSEYVGFYINRNYDRLDFDYPLIKDIVLPRGEHWYNDYSLEMGTSRTRRLFAYARGMHSGFYGGQQREFYAEGGARVNEHLFWGFDYDWNNLSLGGHRATVSNVGTRVSYAFSTQWLTSMFMQWNDLNNRWLLNARLHWIPRVGSDVYLAYNQGVNTEENLALENATVLCKFSYRFVV